MSDNRKPNHVCNNCGKEYYACNKCVKDHPGWWKAYCCSVECFQEWIHKMEDRGVNGELTGTLRQKFIKNNGEDIDKVGEPQSVELVQVTEDTIVHEE